MEATLYVIPGSHPSRTAALMLEQKGIEFKRVDLMPAIHKAALRGLGFPGITVPALKLDGRRVQGSVEIARELDRVVPDPPLLPSDPTLRAEVERAERWGDEVLQPLVRRVSWHALTQDTGAQLTFMEGAKLFPPTPRAVAKASGGALAFLARRINDSTPDKVRADLEALPSHLGRIDGWIADGVLGGESVNAADLQIGASVRLLLTLDDLLPLIDGRPAGELARRWFPEYPGHVGAGALPALPATAGAAG